MDRRLSKSIYDKQLIIKYDKRYQGKLPCPLLKVNISEDVCQNRMDYNHWPRAYDWSICKQIKCPLYKEHQNDITPR